MSKASDNGAVELSMTGSDELPEGWAESTIGEVYEVNPRKVPADALPSDAPVTFVPMPAVDADCGAITAPETREFNAVRKGYTSFIEDDVIVAKITPCMENGKAAVARSLQNCHGFGSSEFHVLRSTGAALPEYVYHFVRQESFRREAESRMTGSVGQKRVPPTFLSQHEFPLPPLAEQKRIVAKVEALLERVDKARQRLDRVPEILKRFRQSVLAAACSGRLTADWRAENGVVEEWATATLGDFGNVSGGITKNARRQSLPLKVPYLRVANVYADRLELSEVHTIGVTDGEFARTRLQEDDLLFVEGNGSIDQIGRVAMWDGSVDNCVHQNHLIRFRASDKALPRYIVYFMMSHKGRDSLIEKAVSTAGLHSLSISKIAGVEVDIPPLAEQREIVHRVERVYAAANAVERRFAVGVKRTERITQSVLARAFAGELVETEADLARREGREYEPASVLLERIAAERSAVSNGTPRRATRAIQRRTRTR